MKTREKVNRQRTIAKIMMLEKPFFIGTKRYSVIFLNPPEPYSNTCMCKLKIPNEPETVMKIEEIRNLPIAKLAAENCLLFFWVFCPQGVASAKDVVKAWGFEYGKAYALWTDSGTNTEDVLRPDGNLIIGFKGVVDPPGEPEGTSDSILNNEKRSSEYRDSLLQAFENAYSNMPRLYLSARKCSGGWFFEAEEGK